ncbi:pyridoxal phosphate-dependent aminotransferase [Flexilinea flocculi]|jgi:aminotransferase|uniref:Aspartate/methionine/tyrosine aminotransferase n=1 Tax=Flexilinea flocculi TaxID=1678840 RepID=A0A0S7BWD7_9CHLR|nr:aminotransferase class I/II-fold pyridoxal phosphate-dependent enzyme [Flexilinea flocculi]GAP41492.1 aspartate/methionine/tyrosine aminotransferase [Flexilinea flocculi]
MTNQNNLPKITTSQLYALNAKAKKYPDRIELGRGDPDFDTPEYIIDSVKDFASNHVIWDSPVEGILPLREAIAKRVREINHIDVNPETDIVVTNGGQEAVFLMINTVLTKDDEILVPDPNYNSYRDSIKFSGAVRVSVPTKVEENFRIDPEVVENLITDKTRAILLVSPNNPAGAVIDPEVVKKLVKIAVDHDLIIISDDIYDRFVYDGIQHLSPASLKEAFDRTLTLNAASKQFAMCGWRLGWIVGPKDLIAAVKNYKAIMTGPTTIIGQVGALAALTGKTQSIEKMYNTFVLRRRAVMDGLDRIGMEYGVPEGGQFVFVSIKKFKMTSYEFAQKVLENCHVLVYPGGAYGAQFDDFIRITFLQPEEKLTEALKRMESYLKK